MSFFGEITDEDYKSATVGVPDGLYSAEIIIVKRVEDKYGPKLNWTMVVHDGELKGQYIYKNTPLSFKSEQAKKIQSGEMKEDFKSCGFDGDIKDLEIKSKLDKNTQEEIEYLPFFTGKIVEVSKTKSEYNDKETGQKREFVKTKIKRLIRDKETAPSPTLKPVKEKKAAPVAEMIDDDIPF